MLHLSFLKKATAFSMRDTEKSCSQKKHFSSNNHSEKENKHFTQRLQTGSYLQAIVSLN